MQIGDALSEHARKKLLLDRLQPFHVYLAESSRKGGAPKYCLLVCLGPCFAFFINSNLNANMVWNNEERRLLQVRLSHEENPFLSNPDGCYIDCSQLVDSTYDLAAVSSIIDGQARCVGLIDTASRTLVVQCVRENGFISDIQRDLILNCLLGS